jgi:membrane-associated phospholipid phosphatase
MKKLLLWFAFFSMGFSMIYGEDPPPPPIKLVFHNIGQNLLGSITYNYGLNFIGAGLGTWAFIETGIDWRWRNVSYNNQWLSNCGLPGLYIGFIIPAITPIATYSIGRFNDNNKLQITGMALLQSLMLTLAVQTPLKMITGRALPGVVTELDHTRNPRTDDFSGEFNWFNLNFIGGWPSGHTANAFAAAATIAEIYKDEVWLKIGVYAYAALIGFGVTLDVHWASEALAGALIGYAVGKTVGKSFANLLKEDETSDHISFYFTLNSAGVIIKL